MAICRSGERCSRAVAASARQPLGERAQCKEEAPGREKEKGMEGAAALGVREGEGWQRTAVGLGCGAL